MGIAMTKKLHLCSYLLFLATGAAAYAQPVLGTLVVESAVFRSEVSLSKKVQAQLETGGLEWGQSGDRIVFTLVNKRFINFDLPYFTRYGETRSVDLPPGEYHVTCIGLVLHTAFSPEKVLSKGAYFNEDALTLKVEAGKTTTLAIQPVIRKQATFFLTYFVPELLATARRDDVSSEAISLNAQTAKSVKWDDYAGDLKFRH
jgi:hypothetical protein